MSQQVVFASLGLWIILGNVIKECCYLLSEKPWSPEFQARDPRMSSASCTWQGRDPDWVKQGL